MMNVFRLILPLFLLLFLQVSSVQAQLSNMIIRHSIQRSQLNNRINSQMMFNKMMRDKVLAEHGQATTEAPLTYFTKGPSTVIDEMAQQTGQNKATLAQSLSEFYQLMKRNELYEQDYANGIALATALNYLSYHNESYLDKKGVNITASMLRHVFIQDPTFAKKTDREKQNELENMAIAAMTAQTLRQQNDARAKDMAGQLLQNTLGVNPTSITFGSGGFFTTEIQGLDSQKIKQINTSFQRTNQCISCEQYAIDNGNTAAYYQEVLRDFDRQLQQKGEATNDLLPMLTQCFFICYSIAKDGYSLNEQQLQSARAMILEGFSNPEDAILHLADQQKQINYESYAIGTMVMQQNYSAALKKQQDTKRSGDLLDQAWEIAASSYDPNSPEKIKELAENYLRNILYPVVLSDYILTENGFIHK